MNRQEFNHNDLEGPDADIEISLKEYGLAWIESETDILFYYGVDMNNDPENFEPNEYDRFDFCTFSKDTDIFEEYDWADFKAIRSFTGLTQDEFVNLSLIQQISDINSYYGYENTFGSRSWEGLTYNEIVPD